MIIHYMSKFLNVLKTAKKCDATELLEQPPARAGTGNRIMEIAYIRALECNLISQWCN